MVASAAALEVFWYALWCLFVGGFFLLGLFCLVCVALIGDATERGVAGAVFILATAAGVCTFLGLLTLAGFSWWYLLPIPASLGLAWVWLLPLFQSIRKRWADVGMGSLVLDSLKQATRQRDWTVMANTADRLAELGRKDAIPALIEAWEVAEWARATPALRACEAALLALGWRAESARHQALLGQADRLAEQEEARERAEVARQQRQKCPDCASNQWEWDVDPNTFADIRVCNVCGYGKR